MAAMGRAVERQGAQACLDFLADRGIAVVADRPGRLKQLMEALARVIRDARNEPRPAPARAEVLGALLRAQEEAEAAHPETDDLEDGAALTRPAEHCDALLDLTEAMARDEPAVSGPLIRYLATLADEDEEDEEDEAGEGDGADGAEAEAASSVDGR